MTESKLLKANDLDNQLRFQEKLSEAMKKAENQKD